MTAGTEALRWMKRQKRQETRGDHQEARDKDKGSIKVDTDH